MARLYFDRDGLRPPDGPNGTYQFTWSNVSAATYAVTAKAIDSANVSTTSSPATVINVVAPSGPTVSIDQPAADQHFTAGASVQIAATATPAPNRSISSVAFYANNNLIGTDGGAPYSISWSTTSTTPTGPYDLKAIATDDFGATGTSPLRRIYIDPAAGNPTVSIQSPSNGQHFTSPASIQITVNASATLPRTINRVDFYADGSGTPFATDNSPPNSPPYYTATFNTSVLNGHTLTATAVDDQNHTSSATITVYVDPPQPPPPSGNFENARLDPVNRTGQAGEDLFSGNFNWSLPLVGLSGRAGLGVGLTLAYNSLTWTKDGSSIKFNADNGYPSPGFRLGLPVIQGPFSNTQTGGNSYLMIMPSGYRVDLRKVGATTLYESADSSYMQFDTASLVARMSDGTQLSFVLKNQEYRCTQVKDRNGNFITASYDDTGAIDEITDTLGRKLKFDYDGPGHLLRIKQLWNGAWRDWATFGYINQQVQTNFAGLNVIGPGNGTQVPMLTQVGLADGSRYVFAYNSYLQVYQVTEFAKDTHRLNHVTYNLPLNATVAQADCPRFTTRADYVERWNNGNEVGTTFFFASDRTYGQVTLPDGTIYKELFATTGYQKGLATQTEIWSGGVRKKWTTVAWTQDNIGVSYILNPRPTETNVYDDVNNRRRSTVGYQTFSLPSGVTCALPNQTDEYAANATTVLRQTQTTYNLTATYINSTRRIIGLPDTQSLYEGPGTTLLAKVDYQYDVVGYLLTTPSTSVNREDVPAGQGRGNLCITRRYDVNSPTNTSLAASYSTWYDTAGNVRISSDPLGHQTTVSYTDNFAATATTIPGTTLAYPTTVTDANGYFSTAQYNYDLGVVRQATDPKGASRTTTYDAAGRVSRVDVSNGAYTSYTYPDTMTGVNTFTLVDTGLPELYSFQQLDGIGRVKGSASTFPTNTGGPYRATYRHYDVMGRVAQQSNPTEIITSNGNWLPAGESSTWEWTTQTYDWKGRALVTTNPDGTTRQLSYGGCGCAGGEQVTAKDESNRQQRTTYDVLGRVAKSEVFNSDSSVYATTGYLYNARDQVTRVRQYQGTDASSTYQDTLMSYDGHARLQSRHLPSEQTSTGQPAYTTFAYYADDSLHIKTDARAATATYTYNARHLVTLIDYAKPAGSAPEESPITDPNAIPNSNDVSFDYDAAGNRLWMSESLNGVQQGRSDYVYDTWSRLTSETRQFTGVTGSWQLQYTYTLSGALKSLTDAFDQRGD